MVFVALNLQFPSQISTSREICNTAIKNCYLSGFVEQEMKRDKARENGKDQGVKVRLGYVRRYVDQWIMNAALIQLHFTQRYMQHIMQRNLPQQYINITVVLSDSLHLYHHHQKEIYCPCRNLPMPAWSGAMVSQWLHPVRRRFQPLPYLIVVAIYPTVADRIIMRLYTWTG